MDKAEFDRFADEYRDLHSRNIRVSGEPPEFFAEYKVRDVARLVGRAGLSKPLQVLDFGAGVGNSVPFFAKHMPSARLTCIDVSPRSIAVAAERFPNMAEYRTFNGRMLPFAEASFDVVFTACVFHHIPTFEHDDLFCEIHRVLRPSGLFVIFEHNPRNPLTIRAVNSCPLDQNAVLIDATMLQSRVAGAGFSKIHCAYRIFFPAALSVLRPLESLLAWLPLGAQYYLAAIKANAY